MALSISNSKTYELLISLLAKCPITIEIVPGDGSLWMHGNGSDDSISYTPFLFVQNHLGIPHKVLYAVYLYAVGVFKAARLSYSSCQCTEEVQGNLPSSTKRTLIASSSVLILANPSHQTALNVRKQFVHKQLIDPRTELSLMASLLSSQHCAKHAELWYHRRWLLSGAYEPHHTQPSTGLPIFKQLSRDALETELALVSRACELYPRNYFAWTHRLICMRNVLSDDPTITSKSAELISILRQEITEIKRWIECHISDYSAVHYVTTLARDIIQNKDLPLTKIITEEGLLAHATSLVQEYPSHEALWLYARTAPSFGKVF
ncbi:hypothetical protein HYDPIDRAFT_178117 [Hydnomerulius pinastri MD-312]|uniref:Protein prenylyltransferase n=1 Tax=Hydnomerulius pinastri MD-312 TaxID=994086 RepID=A0A0C9UYF9_9AGAM|nr:hypothetical protein HYDPIDRAFT_178117 [Hydnomerulius pinastri MD-312]